VDLIFGACVVLRHNRRGCVYNVPRVWCRVLSVVCVCVLVCVCAGVVHMCLVLELVFGVGVWFWCFVLVFGVDV